MKTRSMYANVTATLALVAALGGTAYASTLAHNSVGSYQIKDDAVRTSEIKNHAILREDVHAGVLQPPGSPKVVTSSRGVTVLTGDMVLASLTLPAGKWLVFSHIGSAHKDTDSSARIECTLSEPGGSGGDFMKLRLPPNSDSANSLVFSDVTLHAPMSFSAKTVVKTTCSDVGAGDTGFDITTRKMTAIRVGSIAEQS